MFEGTRLSYIVPGYTGHIPQKDEGEYGEVKMDVQNHIPGYNGYIHSMKSENIFAKTYGKLTYMINSSDYEKGQDVDPRHRYTSMAADTFVNQRGVIQRTAAEIVGVKPSAISYQAGPEDSKAVDFLKTVKDKYPNGMNTNCMSQTQVNLGETSTKDQFKQSILNNPLLHEKPEKEPLKLGTPLPGYTGTARRVVPANIFGLTYANSLKAAKDDLDRINRNRENNFKMQASVIPKIK